jgi:hypothetical protein
MILSAIFSTLNSVIFVIVLRHFLTATVLGHSLRYSAQSFFDCYSVRQVFLLLHCSVIPPWYSTQPFLVATVLSHFLLLQPQSFIRLHHGREAARSGEARMREVAHGSVADAWG